MDSKVWMEIVRKPYPSDVSDEEWSLIVPYLTARGCGAARAQPARGVQWPALHREDGRAVALDTERPAALGCGLSADAALAGGGMLRSVGGRSARRAASGGWSHR